MARLSAAAYAKKHARTGDRIARRAARLRNSSASAQGFNPSTGPSLASQIARALKRPCVIAVGRPTTAEGATTFHFSVKPITKGSEATALAGGTARPGAARAHQRYVEREGAAEETLADIDVNHFAIEQQQYLERPEAVEQGHVLASFGNISDIFEERMDFWRLVEESEYAPKSHVITFNPGHDAEFWKAVDTPALDAPTQLIEAARDKSTTLRVDDRTAAGILTFFKAHQSPGNEKSPAIGIEIGRGGQIQTRIIAELPHEVSAEKRMQIARDFCEARIADIEPPDTEGPRKGIKKTLRYWAVIHAPDSHNDNRNNHLHVVFYERPTDKTLDRTTRKMQWDFAIIESFTNYRKTRTHRPHEQNRSRAVQNKKWPVESRAYFAKLVNAALEDAGVKRRIDPRTYTEMGIDEKPVRRMEPKAYQKEKQGIPTSAGEQTIADQWDRELKRISKLYDTVVFDNAVIDRFNAAADRFRSKLHTSTTEVEKTFDRWAKAVVAKRGVLAERAAVLFNVAKIRSRLTPPLDHRSKAEIAATKAMIDALQKDELTPLNHLYRRALKNEKDELATLHKLERAYSGTPQAAAAAAAPPIATPVKASVKAKQGVAPLATSRQQPPQQPKRAAAFNAAPGPTISAAANPKTATQTTPPPSPAAAAKSIPPKRPLGSIPGLGSATPQPKPTPNRAAFSNEALWQMEAERVRQWNEAVRVWHVKHDAFTKPIKDAIANNVALITSNDAIRTFEDAERALDPLYANLRAKEPPPTKEELAKSAKVDSELRQFLLDGTPIYIRPGTPPEARENLVKEISIIAEREIGTVLGAAASKALAALQTSPSPTPQPQPAPPSAATAEPPRNPPIAAEPPAAQPTAQPQPPTAVPPHAAAKAVDPNGAETKAPEAKATEAKPDAAKAVEPQPDAAPPPRPLIQRPNLYRRRTRELTPGEREALTKTRITSKPKPKDDIPETMPAHAQRRRPALHDNEPSPNDPPPSAGPTTAGTARQSAAPPAQSPPPAPPVEHAPPAAEPTSQQPPAAAVTKAAKPPASAAEPPPPTVGPTVDIAALPAAKKRRKKKISELSAEERRRNIIARQTARIPQR